MPGQDETLREESLAGGPIPPHLTRGILALWAREGKWAEVALEGVSMTPVIPDGSSLTVRFGRSGLVQGDVILYASGSRLIAHRVLRLGRSGRRWGWLKVKGDPLHVWEASWIPVEDVVGRVVGVRRPDGSRILLNTPGGRLAGRLASLISGPVAWAESKAVRLGTGSRGGRPRLHVTRALLAAPDLIYARTGRPRGRGAGITWDPTRRFLLQAARLRLTPRDRAAVEAMLRRDLPWESIVPAAVRLGLAPVLFRNLTEGSLAGAVPPAALSELRRGAHGSACLMAIQMEGLARIHAALGRAGIDPVLLKGTALAVTLYQQPALRPMQDLDLLVRPGEVDRAVGVLREMGFRGIHGPLGPSFYAAHHHALPMIDPRGRLIVEIHRGLVPPSGGIALDPEPFLDRAVRVEGRERGYRVLSLEDQVLHAALHLSHTDRFMGKLRDLLDIHALLESSGETDWGILVQASRSWAASRSVYATLDLARRLLGTDVPREVLSELSRGARWDPLASSAVRMLGRWSLFEGGSDGRLLSDPVLKALCDAFLKRSRWMERLRWLAGSLGRSAGAAI